MNNEVTVITPEQFGLEKKEASNIEKAFEPKIKEREILSSQYGELVKKDITQETCIEARGLRLKLVKVRTGISDVHKVQKTFFLAAGKFVDAWKNKETLPVTQMEDGLRKIENHFAEIEEAKREVIRKERNAELEKYDTIHGMGDIAQMDADVWRHFLNDVKSEFEEKKAEEVRAEKERREDERIEKLRWKRADEIKPYYDFFQEKEGQYLGKISQDDFNKILSDLKAKKSDYQKKQEKIRKENEQLKKEAELKQIADEKAEKERKRLAKIEQDKRDAERKEFEAAARIKEAKERAAHDEELRKEREDKERIQKELLAKVEVERKRKDAEQLELIHIQKEKEKVKADARKAELAPDKERLTKWIANMTIYNPINQRMSKESVLIAGEITDKYNAFKNWATEKVNQIK